MKFLFTPIFVVPFVWVAFVWLAIATDFPQRKPSGSATDSGIELSNLGIDYAQQKQLPLLGIKSDGDYGMLLVDVTGRLLFECRKCPDKMCHHLACRGGIQPDGPMSFDCECVK